MKLKKKLHDDEERIIDTTTEKIDDLDAVPEAEVPVKRKTNKKKVTAAVSVLLFVIGIFLHFLWYFLKRRLRYIEEN